MKAEVYDHLRKPFLPEQASLLRFVHVEQSTNPVNWMRLHLPYPLFCCCFSSYLYSLPNIRTYYLITSSSLSWLRPVYTRLVKWSQAQFLIFSKRK